MSRRFSGRSAFGLGNGELDWILGSHLRVMVVVGRRKSWGGHSSVLDRI